jgi:hypothetical protein
MVFKLKTNISRLDLNIYSTQYFFHHQNICLFTLSPLNVDRSCRERDRGERRVSFSLKTSSNSWGGGGKLGERGKKKESQDVCGNIKFVYICGFNERKLIKK